MNKGETGEKVEVSTERCCESVKAAGKRKEYRVSKSPGLYFRVTPHDVKSWSLVYTDKRTGKKRRLDLGRYIPGQDKIKVEEREGVTLAKARQLAKEHVADIGNGADPARGVTLRRESITFRELAENKLKAMGTSLGGRPRRSVGNYRSMLERHVYPKIGDLKAADVCRADIERILDKVACSTDARFNATPTGGDGKTKRKGNPLILTPGRRVSHQPNRVFEMLRSILRYGRKKELIATNPMELMEPPVDDEAARKRHLSLAEIPAFWRSLEAAPITRQLQLAMLTEIVLGQRIGELIRRQKSDIDRSDAVPILSIPECETKNGLPHRIPLPPLAMRLIDEAMSIAPDSKYIFASPVGDGPLTAESATRAMGRLRPHLEASDLRVHDLRRTASNGMRKLGVPKFYISVVLNHVSATKSDVTSEHYFDEFAFEAEKIDALFKWGAKLEEVLVAAGVLPPAVPVEDRATEIGQPMGLSTTAPTTWTAPDVTGSTTAVGAFASAAAIDESRHNNADASVKEREDNVESDRRLGLGHVRTRKLRLGARPGAARQVPGAGRVDGGADHGSDATLIESDHAA